MARFEEAFRTARAHTHSTHTHRHTHRIPSEQLRNQTGAGMKISTSHENHTCYQTILLTVVGRQGGRRASLTPGVFVDSASDMPTPPPPHSASPLSSQALQAAGYPSLAGGSKEAPDFLKRRQRPVFVTVQSHGWVVARPRVRAQCSSGSCRSHRPVLNSRGPPPPPSLREQK